MFRLNWAASVRTRSILSCAPTNLLIATTRTRHVLRWSIPAMLLAIPCLLAAHWCVRTIEAGAPGWPNLVVLLWEWNTIKLTFNGPITLILLVRVRIREIAARRRARRAEYEGPDYAELHSWPLDARGAGLIRDLERLAHESGGVGCVDGETVENVGRLRVVAPSAGDRGNDPAEDVRVARVASEWRCGCAKMNRCRTHSR